MGHVTQADRERRRDRGGRTEPERLSIRDQRRHRLLRRVGLVALAVFVAAGAVNVYGVRDATVSAEEAGTTLRVTYPRVARPGLAIRWELELERRGGFDGPVTVILDTDYLQRFDFNAWHPEPSDSERDGDRLHLTFPAPDGERFALLLDARVSPSLGAGAGTTTTVRTEGAPTLEVRYATAVMP